MNKRIKKKRTRLSPLKTGYNVYTQEEIKVIIMSVLLKVHLLPRIYAASLDPNKSNVCVWKKKNIKRALKYMYKHRNQYLSYNHLRFPTTSNQKPEYMMYTSTSTSTMPKIITGGKSIKYKSSTYIQFTEEDNHE
jgi:hypothetical protein